MKTAGILTLSTYLALTTAGSVFGQTVEWTRQFGSPLNEALRGIAFDATGNVYVTGDTQGTLPGETSAGGTDAFVRKYDAGGEVVWTRQFGTAGNEFVGIVSGGIAVGDEGVYIGGYTNGAFPGHANAGGFDAFLRKYDTDGNEMWTDQFGTPGFDDIHDVAVDSDSDDDDGEDDADEGRTGIYVAGSVIGQLPGQTWGGGSDGFVRRYDSDGNVVWTRQFGTAAGEHPNAIAFDSTGVYVVGTTDGTMPGEVSAGGVDAFVQRYTRAGDLKWTRQFGTAAVDIPQSVAADGGGIYVVGGTDGALPGQTSAGLRDAFVRKYNPGGHEKWTRQFGTPGFDQALGVSSQGQALVVGGAVSGPLPGQTYAGGVRDAFVRKYDASHGDEMWTHQFGTPTFDSAFDTLTDRAGETVYVGGLTDGSLPGQTNSGMFDAYLMKLVQDDE